MQKAIPERIYDQRGLAFEGPRTKPCRWFGALATLSLFGLGIDGTESRRTLILQIAVETSSKMRSKKHEHLDAVRPKGQVEQKDFLDRTIGA
jgi:hypothetical protein